MIGQDLPALAIRRPLLVLVVNLLIALAGLAAISGVEVRELPDIDRPIVTVRGDLPGASPETVDVEVTALVEGAVARVTGVKEVRSSSEEGNFRIRVVFSPDVDLDSAASDVREAVSRVERQLPEAVEQLTVIKADADASPVMRLAASSETLGEEALTRIVEKDVIPALISIDGVATVNLFGDRERMLRVVVDPLRLTSFGLSVSDVAAVLRNAPFDLPAGSFRSEDQELIVRADATVVTADQVRSLTIRGTVAIRRDVAEVFFEAGGCAVLRARRRTARPRPRHRPPSQVEHDQHLRRCDPRGGTPRRTLRRGGDHAHCRRRDVHPRLRARGGHHPVHRRGNRRGHDLALHRLAARHADPDPGDPPGPDRHGGGDLGSSASPSIC